MSKVYLAPYATSIHTEGDISGGGSSGGGALRVIDTNGTLNVTYNDLVNAVNNNVFPILAIPIDEGLIGIYVMSTFGVDDDKYVAVFGDQYFYAASSLTEYLKNSEQEPEDEPIG